jgi:membrane-associated protein
VVSFLTSKLTQLSPVAVYAAVGALLVGETGLFVGFVLPGETAVIVAGFLASRGRVNIVALCVVVVTAVILGGSLGYLIGVRAGERLLRLRVLRRHERAVQRALDGINRRGATYVFIGRFTAFFRAVVPGLAGMSEMSFLRFTVANVSSAVCWGCGYALLGYFAGDAYKRVERISGYAALGLLVVGLAVALTIWFRARTRRRADGESRDKAGDVADTGTQG